MLHHTTKILRNYFFPYFATKQRLLTLTSLPFNKIWGTKTQNTYFLNLFGIWLLILKVASRNFSRKHPYFRANWNQCRKWDPRRIFYMKMMCQSSNDNDCFSTNARHQKQWVCVRSGITRISTNFILTLFLYQNGCLKHSRSFK